MSDRNAKADSSGDLHEIKVLQAEIERLLDRNEVLEKSAEINRRIMDSYGPRFDEYDAEIERLKERLECWPVDKAGNFDKSQGELPQGADGIACRDETIRLLDARIELLTGKIKEGRGPITSWLTDEMNKVKPLEADNERLRSALERIAKYRSKEYKRDEQGHYCMFRSAFEGCRDIAKGALRDD